MEKVYEPASVEKEIYQFWENNGYFEPSGEGESFCIVIPPPNVTGALHIGHALDNTLQDILTRYKRMNGFNVLWVPGTDHAGIATQNVVEKALAKEGISRHDLGREAFVNKVWEWKQEYGGRITMQLRRLGASCDWSHERFTMDEGCSRAVRAVFVKLYKENLIYQGDRIINWCPRCHTALSDVETEYEENKGSLWHYKYPYKDGDGFIEIATTRPETMFGDTAIAVNPNDPRYQDKIGKSVVIPFADREIPVIADEHVDPAFGSGAVKVTPAHDPNDYEIGMRHQLPFVVVMDESAVMNDQVPPQYRGMDRYACRKQLLMDLEAKGYLLQTHDHLNSVGHCYRCNTVIEPYLSKQWFVSMKELVKEPIKAVQDGRTTFMPERWSKAYFDWQENIRDWCVSRQIWWGHRIPVWYCQSCGALICELEDPTVCHCGSKALKQDEDVLDTWFSSALWPFETLGWPDNTQELRTFYPTSVLVTGYDIITFWVSRMMTMGLKFMGQVPFHKVLIHGLVRDAKGKKMSKSTGNAIDPIEVMDKFGTDALRFALASLSTSGGQDIKLSDEKIESSRNFINKLWNVTRFVLMSFKENPSSLVIDQSNLDQADRWILSKYNSVLKRVTHLYENFEFGASCQELYHFVWNDFCDWYVEFSKNRKAEAMPVLFEVLQGILGMLHPTVPFVTESIWAHVFQVLGRNYQPLIRSPWPVGNQDYVDPAVEDKTDRIIDLISAIRNARLESGVKPGNWVNAGWRLAEGAEGVFGSAHQAMLEQLDYVKRLARLEQCDPILAAQPGSIYVGTPCYEVFIPAQGLIDLKQESERLSKLQQKLSKEVGRLAAKLSNQSFVKNAPVEIVQTEQVKLDTYRQQLARLQKQLDSLAL